MCEFNETVQSDCECETADYDREIETLMCVVSACMLISYERCTKTDG